MIPQEKKTGSSSQMNAANWCSYRHSNYQQNLSFSTKDQVNGLCLKSNSTELESTRSTPLHSFHPSQLYEDRSIGPSNRSFDVWNQWPHLLVLPEPQHACHLKCKRWSFHYHVPPSRVRRVLVHHFAHGFSSLVHLRKQGRTHQKSWQIWSNPEILQSKKLQF